MVNFTADKLKQSREAGYSDDEIWGFLSEQDERFNKTKEAGYSLDEVSGFLSEQQPQQEPKPAQPEQPQPPVGTSFMEEIAAIPQAIRQAVDQPLEAMGETAEVLGAPSVGGALRGAVDAAEGYVPAAQRFMEPQEGEFQIGGFAPQFLPRAIVEQAGQIAGAIATRAAGMAVGGLAGSALGPKGTVAGSVAGAFLGPALFEMSQIVGPVARERAANQGREEPTTDDLAWAWGTAGASGSLNAIGAKYLPNGDKLVGGLANKIATAVAGEGATEGLQSVVQQTGQTFLTEQGLEIKPKEALGGAIMGGGAGGAAVVAAAPFTPTPEVKAAAAAETKVAAEQAAPVAPETAQVVSEQANQVISEAQAEETAETPDERVARLEREAQAATGITLEEEAPVSGLPAQPKTTPTTVPTDELLRANTREEINNLVAEGVAREDAITEVGRRRKEQKQSISDSVNIGDEIAVTINAETGAVSRYKIVQDVRGGKAAQMLNEQGASVGPELTLDPDATNSGHSYIAGGKIVNRGSAQPVTPTPESPATPAVAPVEPVVPTETITQEFTQMGEGAVDSYYQAVLQSLQESGEVPTPERRSNVGQAWERVRGQMTPEEFVVQLRQNAEDPSKIQAPAAVEPTVAEVAPTRNLADLEVRPPTDNVQQVAAANDLTVGRADVNIPAQELESTVNLSDPKERERVDNLKEQISSEGGFISRVIVDGQNNVVEGQHRVQAMKELGYDQIPAIQLKSAEDFIPDSNALDKVMQDAGLTASDNRTQMRQLIAEIISDEKGDITQLREYEAPAGFETAWNAATEEVIRQNAATEAVPVAVEPTPVTPTPVTPEVPTAAEPPALAPLRRVAKAEQTEDDVSGLVGQGLVELYNGQPVLTQAGLETLPEAERPRLTPEARKIQIDTRTSEAAAEAISKNLRIGVDQVPVDVKMPAGWTIEGDIYIPPVVEAAPEFAFAQEAEVKKQNIKTNMIRFASGMSGISDLRAGAYTRAGFKNYGVGFDVGLLSKNAIEELADFIINMDTQAFIDSGAFSNFRKSLKAQEGGRTVEALNFDKIFEKYDAILDAIQRINVAERTDYPRPMIVMPDIIGDQNASLDLIDQYKNRVSLEVSSNTSIPIIPIPLGELSLSEAYNRIIEILKTNTIGSEINPENFVVGIPSNAKAVSKEDLAKFLRESKPPRIHFLGAAADRNISPLIDIVSQNSPETQVTADASKVRSAILSGVAKGKTRKQAIFDALYQEDDPEVVLNAATAPQPEAREDVRYNPLGYDITNVVEDIKAGRTDGPLRAVNNVVKDATALRDRVKAEADRRQRPRARGKAAILERIARERSGGKLSEETARALTDFVNSIREEAIGDTAISIKGGGGVSNFDFGQSLVSFFLTQDQPKVGARVGIHEFWHGLSRFLPKTELESMSKDYTRELTKYIDNNPWFLAFVGRYSLTPEQYEAYKIFNPEEAETKLVPVQDSEGNIVKYQIRYDEENYRYIMLDEWIAEKMTDLVESRQAMPNTFMGKLAKIIKEFMAQIQAKLGRDAYQSFYNLVTDPNQKIDLQRMGSVARPFQIYQPQDYNYAEDISDQIRYATIGSEPEPRPTFTEESPEAKTLSNLKASMEKVDGASEAKGGKPETQKISEISANWMEQGGDERALQDAIAENTNLSPVNAAKVAKVIAKQYGLQQQIAETGAVIAEIAPEPEGAPRKSSVTKLIEQTTGVRKPVVKLQVSESAALKKQIQLKAREARETRKARKEAAEELAKAITDYVKANPIRGPINSRQAMSITKRALKLDVNNEAAVDRFEMYVERVIENANYDRDLADARALIKRAKTFAKSKDTQGNVKTTLDAIANISPTLLDNPFEFNLVVQRYLLGLAPVTAKQYAVMPDADVRRYLESLETQISANQDVLNRSKAQRILDKQAAYAEEKGIPLDEAISILNSEEFLQEKTIEKLEDLTKLLTSMAQESQKDVKAYDDAGATPKQKELISFMRKVSLESLTNEEKKRYIRFSNNLLANGATFGMEQFQSIALGQEAAMKAVKDKRLSNKLAAWISPIGGDKAIDTARRIALRTQSEADTFKNIFGREAVGAFRNILGLNRLDVAQTDSNRAKEKIANEFGEYFKGLRKKYGDNATGFEAKGYAGIAGYLIQTDGIKTEAESIPYRRRLMEQNIAELRKSDKQTDLAEADLKERALAQLTGTTNAEILSQLRALNPASYEQLMWVKDVMLPKWRDFLKEHDENFRNQANNYNNPDHLTITYKFPEGQLLPNEIEDVYQQDAIGMRIKQAANSIKRKEHANLPVSPRTGTVANIDINFGYNQYNALVDQVDKAFVAPAWEQVVSFTKAPEFEQIMGGRANSLFVKKLLTDIQTSRTRQSMTDDEAQMVAGGVRLARKISTQAVLGGITQPLRQIPDQLTKLFFTTGRFDLITKNLLATAQAAPLLNKFPIGRRGDAQAGTQYASQFSELARKVEASVTDRKWAQYRELMNRVGEFWMAPLRGSDVWAAKVSWMSYYEAELNKKGIKMESWEREAELVDTDQDRKEAASYAEFAVDFYGGASDPTKMASLSKQTNNGWKEFAKLVFLPLNSFALQQKNSLISDLRDAYLRTGDRKASIAAIAGTLAGMAAFHGTRIYIIGGLVYPAGKALLMGIFGIDMEEPDEEEKQKKLEDDWRKFKASMYGNIIAGGAGEFAEKAAIDAVNRATYLIQANVNPDELLNDKGEIMSFRQYEKDVSPLYRFRSYGPSEYSFGLADVLTEQATHALAETQQIMTPEEMEKYTGNEQAYAMFSTMVEWLYFFRLMDTDVTRIARDLKRQMDKGVEEREKEIKAIRSGR